jgi:hypothetical protein
LKSNVITRNALTGLIDNEFWNSLMKSIEEKVPHANTTTSLNLSRALQDNEITAKNKSLLEKVNNRIDVLSKRR